MPHTHTHVYTSGMSEVNDARSWVLTHDIKSTESRSKTRHLLTTGYIDPRQITVSILHAQTHTQPWGRADKHIFTIITLPNGQTDNNSHLHTEGKDYSELHDIWHVAHMNSQSLLHRHGTVMVWQAQSYNDSSRHSCINQAALNQWVNFHSLYCCSLINFHN